MQLIFTRRFLETLTLLLLMFHKIFKNISCFIFALLIPFSTGQKCKPEKSINILECQKFGLMEVPDLPQVVANQIFKMNLSSNFIQILHEDNFKYYTNLVELVIDDNRLQKITENALYGLVKLKILSLRNNILVIQPECLSHKAFKSLNKLIRLDLSENPLGIIKENFFRSLKNLEELLIEKAVKGLIIEKGAFRGLVSLNFISLAYNDFETIPEYLIEDFRKMSLTQILLHGNKWNCDCNLRWLKTIIDEVARKNNNNEYSKYIRPTCERPAPFSRMELQMIKESDYQCPPKIFTKGYTVTAFPNTNISLTCEIYSNPVSKISWYKDDVLIQGPWNGIKLWSTNTYKTNATLFIENAENGFDNGQYKCEAGNILGRVSTKFSVKILSNFNTKRAQVNQILTLIGIGALVLILLIGIIAIFIYVFLRKKSQCIENGMQNRYRNRTPKPEPVDHSEALENLHFLDNARETIINNSHPVHDVNSMLTSSIMTSNETKNVKFLNQLMTNYASQCPVHCMESDSETVPNPCPLHGTTPILSKQCILNCSPILVCTSSFNTPQSPYTSHYSNSNTLNTRNSLLGNVGAFYSLEQLKMPKSSNFPDEYRNQSMISSFTHNPN